MTDQNLIARWVLIAALLLASAGAFAQDDELRKTFFREADTADEHTAAGPTVDPGTSVSGPMC